MSDMFLGSDMLQLVAKMNADPWEHIFCQRIALVREAAGGVNLRIGGEKLAIARVGNSDFESVSSQELHKPTTVALVAH